MSLPILDQYLLAFGIQSKEEEKTFTITGCCPSHTSKDPSKRSRADQRCAPVDRRLPSLKRAARKDVGKTYRPSEEMIHPLRTAPLARRSVCVYVVFGIFLACTTPASRPSKWNSKSINRSQTKRKVMRTRAGQEC